MKDYKEDFKEYLLKVKNLGYGTVSSYCSYISYLDSQIKQTDNSHTTILQLLDSELLELYYHEYSDSKEFKSSKNGSNSLSALKAYIKFCNYYKKNNYEITPTNHNADESSSPHKLWKGNETKSYEAAFINYAKKLPLENSTIRNYCSAITIHIDNYIRKYIKKDHDSIFYIVDTELLNAWHNILLDKEEYYKHSECTHNQIKCAFQKYIEFAKFYRNNLEIPQAEYYTLNATDSSTDNSMSIEEIEKEISTFSKYNQPIPSELLEAKERALAIEKKKKQRLLKNNIEYSLNNILTQIPTSLEYNITYTKEKGFCIEFTN